MDAQIEKYPLKRLFGYFAQYKKEFLTAIFALFLTAFAILLFGKVAKIFIDHAILGSSDLGLKLFLLSFAFLVLVLSLAGFLRSKLVNSICLKISAKLKNQIYQNLINISPQFFNENKIGDIISRISSDIDNISSIITTNFAFFLRNLILFIGAISMLFISSPKLSLITLISILCALIPLILFSKKIKSLGAESSQKSADLISQTEESLSAIKTIQAFLSEKIMIAKFAQENQNSLNLNLKKSSLKSFLIAITIFFAFISVAIILYIGAIDIRLNQMSSGQLSSFIFYAVISAISLIGLGQIFSQIQPLRTSLSRIFFLIDVKSPVQESENSIKHLKDEEIDISFQNVNFSYGNKEQILQDFNLEIKHGQKVLIYGRSGSGKSTILNLLMRFYDLSSGAILLNDKNISRLSFKALRENFSYSAQDNQVFSGTILQNIKLGNEGLKDKKVEDLIKSSKAFDFIKDSPQFLQTQVGEKGSNLSGGQKQRIAILRTLLKDSKIMLFDEPTSSLDEENESQIIDLIKRESEGKTLIIISHKKYDQINFDQEVSLH